MNQRFGQTSERIAALAARLESLSPLNVLTRGYSLTHKVGGELVRNSLDVKLRGSPQNASGQGRNPIAG